MPKLIKVCRVRALEKPDGIVVQILCQWKDSVFHVSFDNWKDFGERINNVIKELKETV